jgi:hypothetical protein
MRKMEIVAEDGVLYQSGHLYSVEGVAAGIY